MKNSRKIALALTIMVLILTGCSKPITTADFNKDKAITVVSREDGSGTRGAFVELLGIEQKDANGEKVDHTIDLAIISNSTSIVMSNVSSNAYAIGYISLGSLNDTIKALKIDGVAATVDNIKSNTYKVARPFNIATKDAISAVAQDFINYILSTEGQSVVEENGYVSLGDNGTFTTESPIGKIVIGGSSSVSPVMEKLKEAYLSLNANAKIEIQQTDSTSGMTSVIDGVVDIGMASRELKQSELDAGLNNIVIAMDGIAVIVNNNNPLDDITSDEVRAVYMGEITDWSALFE